MGTLGHHTLVRLQQLQEQWYPFLPVCAVFLSVQTGVWLPVSGLFNVLTNVDVHDSARGLYKHHKRVCAENWLWEKNMLLLQGIEPVPGFLVQHFTNWANYPHFLPPPLLLAFTDMLAWTWWHWCPHKKSYIAPCPYSAIGACFLRKRVTCIQQCWYWVLCSHRADFSCFRWLTEWLCLFWTQIAFHEINPFPMRLVSNKRVHHLQMVRVSARAVLCMRFGCGIKQQQQKAQTAPSPFLNSFKAFRVLRCRT